MEGDALALGGRRESVVDMSEGKVIAHALGDQRHLGPVPDLQLTHQRSHVRFNGRFRDAEIEGDLLVQQAEVDALENLFLGWREARQRRRWLGVRKFDDARRVAGSDLAFVKHLSPLYPFTVSAGHPVSPQAT